MKHDKYKLSQYNVIHNKGGLQYIWNTYSDALVELDKDGQSYLRNFIGIDDGSTEFDLLKKNGFVVGEQINEFIRVCMNEKYDLYSMDTSTIGFVIAPGMGCNYNCVYCFQSTVDKSGVMTKEVADDVATFICNCLEGNRNVKNIDVMWFGGEPLLYVDIIESISRIVIKYTNTHEINYRASITTNGLLLDKRTLELLLELSINSAQITVDGLRDSYCISKGAVPEDFECVIENIRNAAEKVDLTVRINIPDNDVYEAINITEYLLTQCSLLNKINIHFAYVCDYTAQRNVSKQSYLHYVDNYLLYLKYIVDNYRTVCSRLSKPKRRSTSCGLVRVSNICIGSRGELYKCEHRFGDSSFIMGDIWNGHYYNNAELAYCFTVDLDEKCTQCQYTPICMGGCADDRVSGFTRYDCEAYKRIQLELKLIEGGKY